MGTKSHLIQLYPIVEKLLDSGHKVTGIYFNSAKIKHENYTEILIENPFEAKMAEISKMFMEKGGTSIVNLKLWQASWAAWSESIEDMSMLPWRQARLMAVTPSLPTMLISTSGLVKMVATPWELPSIQANIRGDKSLQ